MRLYFGDKWFTEKKPAQNFWQVLHLFSKKNGVH